MVLAENDFWGRILVGPKTLGVVKSFYDLSTDADMMQS
jgi:hypothetical protein